jgi:predicted nucleic acid-binding protein
VSEPLAPVYVLDSFAMLAYLEDEPGAERVKAVLQAAVQQATQVHLSQINLGEVLYITERERGLAAAQKVLAAIEQLPVELLSVTKDRILDAAHIKAHCSVAYADAFTIAAAKELRGVILTGDPEYSAVKELVDIVWLPRG